jgi:hypothetical protein
MKAIGRHVRGRPLETIRDYKVQRQRGRKACRVISGELAADALALHAFEEVQ